MTGRVSTRVGTGVRGALGDGGPADLAQFDNPYGIGRGPDGLLYLCDMENHRVRRIAADGTIETVAGCGRAGWTGDGGPATDAALDEPYEIGWDRAGHLHFVELGNHVIRRVDARTGILSTVAGGGKPGFAGDGGPAARALFNQPHSLAFDRSGDLFVCDIGNHRVRRIDRRRGTISTWCGTGAPTTAPDGAAIAGAALHGPRALAFGPGGVGYLALREGNAVLRLDPKSGTLRRIAQNLAGPKGIAVDRRGDVFLADTESHTIRRIDARHGTVSILVGDGRRGDGPDGDPLHCRLARPHGVFVDGDGAVWIGDSENHRVRVWRRSA